MKAKLCAKGKHLNPNGATPSKSKFEVMIFHDPKKWGFGVDGDEYGATLTNINLLIDGAGKKVSIYNEQAEP